MTRLFHRYFAGRFVAPVLLLLFTFVFKSTASAQVRPRGDTTAVRPDTVRADTTGFAVDSVQPARVLVRQAEGPRPSFANAVWEWNREDLLREGVLSLGELLQRNLPGLLVYRAGTLLQPEAASPYGGTRNSYEVFLDGYQLDPLVEPTFDLSRIELVELSHVRVVRRLDVTRIELRTYAATLGVAESRIEAGVGEPDTNMFRGLLLSPKFLFGPFGIGIERVDTDGLVGTQPADVFAGWAKWGWILANGAGIEAEFRRNTLNRTSESPWISRGRREDFIVRGRAPIVTGLVAELFAGASSFELDTLSTDIPEDSIRPSKLDETAVQYGARASFQNDLIWADVSARGRDTDLLPQFQFDAAGGARLGGYGEVNGYLTQENWEGNSASSYTLRAIAGPLAGIRVFGEIFGGDRGAQVRFDSAGAFLTSRSGTRFGAEFNRWGINVGAALLNIETDSVQTFGLPFDTTTMLFPGGDRTGWEVSGRAQLFVPWLFAEGTYTNWLDGTSWIYLPNQIWRAGLVLHAIPLKSGNLEIFGRLEARYRGAVLMPVLVQEPEGTEFFEPVPFDDYTVVDGYLQIRIMSVRLFIRGDNMLGAEYFEVPEQLIRRPRIFYGVKWDFRS